jgi:DNA-binding NarL/FixJ family response regulator
MTSDQKKIRLLLVDDHPVLREGLANLLHREPDFEVVGQAGTGEEAVRIVRDCRPDVCLLDLSLPGMDGFETLARLRAARPAAQVLMLTSSESAFDADRALRDGASGFISKNIEHRGIAAAVRDVHRGATGIRRGIEAAQRPRDKGLLTPRELEVLALMRKGLSNVEIGRQLGITERTVKGHVTEMLVKLGASDRASAVARGFELGILAMPSTAARPAAQ